MLGLLPPSSSVTRFSDCPHLAPISRPTTVDPVKATLSTPGWSTIAAPVSPSPLRMLTVPGGIPASRTSSPSLNALSGVCSAGLRIVVQPAGQHRRQLPRGHQQGEVPGDDLGADPDRLAARVAEDVAGGDRDRLALDLGRPAGEVAEVVDGGGDVALGGRQRLAVVERLELGELVAVCLDQLGQAPDQGGALRRVDLRPGSLERLARRRGGAIDVLGARLRHLADRLARGGVDRGEGAPVGGLEPLLADQQAPGPRSRKARAGSERDAACDVMVTGDILGPTHPTGTSHIAGPGCGTIYGSMVQRFLTWAYGRLGRHYPYVFATSRSRPPGS